MNTALQLAFQTPGVDRVVNELTLAGRRPLSPPRVKCRDVARSPICEPATRFEQGRDLRPRTDDGRRTRPGEAAGNGHVSGPDSESEPTRRCQLVSVQRRSRRLSAEESQREAGRSQCRSACSSRWERTVWRCSSPCRGGRWHPARPLPMYTAAAGRGGRGPGPLRPALHAQLCLAGLRGLPELRRCDLSRSSTRRRLGPISVHSTPIRRFRSDGGR